MDASWLTKYPRAAAMRQRDDDVLEYTPHEEDTGWARPHQPRLHEGDRLTMAGFFARRTVWQWLTRQPRRLQVFTVRENVCSSKGRTVTY